MKILIDVRLLAVRWHDRRNNWEHTLWGRWDQILLRHCISLSWYNDFIFVIRCNIAVKIYFSLNKHLLAQLHLLVKPGFPHCIAIWSFLYVRWFYLHGLSLDCFVHWSVFISLITELNIKSFHLVLQVL